MTATQHRALIVDPCEFQRVYLRRRLWARQKEILRAVEQHRVVAVKGCHASGKTFVAAGLAIWWLCRYQDAKVLTISPTLRQVKTFWGEVELARQSCQVSLPPCTTTGLEVDKGRYAMGASSSRSVNLQGLHGGHVLIITDESPGIEAEIWDAIEGIRSGGHVRMLKLGNPTVPSGQFFDDFKSRSTVEPMTISAFDTPNLRNPETGQPFTIAELEAMTEAELNHNPIPYLAQRWWVLERYRKWGRDSPRFASRVLGEFPSQSDWAVFDLRWIEEASREPKDEELARARGHYIQVGIDVAGGGDDETVLYARVDGIILEHHAWSMADAGGNIISELRRIRHEYRDLYQMGPVVVDVVGVGFHLAPRLAAEGFEVFGFQAGASAADGEQFANAKAEAYWAAREFFKEGWISGLTDEETIEQLGTIQYRETYRGKTEIEPKEEAREKRGVRSPDRAEALIMALMPVTPRHQMAVYGSRDTRDW